MDFAPLTSYDFQNGDDMWGMRRNPTGWSHPQFDAMPWLQRRVVRTKTPEESPWTCVPG